MSAASSAGAVRWLWHSASPLASLGRGALLPLAGLYRVATGLRNAAYQVGVFGSRRMPRFAIGVGNLAVGGTGKTPLTAFLAAGLKKRGVTAGVVLRGYGADEVAEHRAANPEAAVEADPDRHAAAARAVARGAEALVLDDCLQRRDVTTDVMLAVVSADTWSPVRWPLPSGPWREDLGALARADVVVVTRKAVDREAAELLARALAPETRGGQGIVAALEITALPTLAGAVGVDPALLAGREVLAVSGIGEPGLFAEQLRRLGARVSALAFGDHHAYGAADVQQIAAAAGNRWVVTTAKDAVKLKDQWPEGGPACFVARLGVRIETGAEFIEQLLDRAATAARKDNPGTAAASSARES